MSWQTYVDNNLVGSKLVTKAVIFGHNAGVWAANGVNPSQAEMQAIVGGFVDPGNLRAGGIKLQGDKFFCLRADDRSIYGKQGAGGCACVKTKQAVIVGVYDESVQPGQATNCVESLADYLIDQGF